MSAILLPGQNLKGHIPRASTLGIATSGPHIAFSALLTNNGAMTNYAAPINIRPGMLLRVPKVIWLINDVFSPYESSTHSFDTSQSDIVDSVFSNVAARIANAIPDAMVLSASLGGQAAYYAFLASYLPELFGATGVPCLYPDFLGIFAGIFGSANAISSAQIQSALKLANAMPAFACHVFAADPTEYQDSSTKQTYVGLLNTMTSNISQAATAGIDITLDAISVPDLVGDDVAAVVSDHYGVTI